MTSYSNDKIFSKKKKKIYIYIVMIRKNALIFY